MARTMFDNMRAAVANTRSNDIKMIDISELHDSADNFFTVDRIEELAEEILTQGGVKENLIVKSNSDGGYEIISGHRRKSAVQYLIDKGEKVSHVLPCLVESYTDEDSKKIDLILMNVSQRRLSDSELYKSYEELNLIFQRKKETGEKLGNLRAKIAEILNVSPAQIGKMQNIEKNAVPEVKVALEEGKISANAADKVASLSSDEQKKLIAENPDGVSAKKADAAKKSKSSDKTVGSSSSGDKDTKKVAINSNFDNHADLVDFVSANKAILAKAIEDCCGCLDENSHELEIINQLADIISKF